MSGRRLRRALLAVAAISLILLSGYGAASAALYYQTADFFCLWNGARLVAGGVDPYDAEVWHVATDGLYPDPRGGLRAVTCSFGYPLWTAIALVPFGMLPLELAATLWIAAGIAATLAGTLLAWRAAGGPARLTLLLLALVLFSQPFWVLLVGGQITGVMLALVGLVAWGMSRRREATSGVALAWLALKPQIGTLFMPVLLLEAIATRRWRFVAGSLLAGAALLLVSLTVAPRWPLEWLAELERQRGRASPQLATAWGLAADLTGTALWGAALVVALAAAVWAIARADALRGPTLTGITLSLSLFAAPYVWSYDFLVLALPWSVTLARISRAEGARRVALLLGLVACASLLPWALYAIAFPRGKETLSALVPAATALLLAATVAGTRQRDVAASAA